MARGGAPTGKGRGPGAAPTLPSTPGGWRCIVADPPWSFRDKGSRAAPDQRQKREEGEGYRTMPLEAIAALPVAELAARDALLFLWSTSAHLVDGSAIRVAQAWGFTPKATMCWVKTSRPRLGGWPVLQVGMGHYVRGAHELVLVCRRGDARVLRRDVPSVFFAPRTTHSTKPERFLELVEGLAAGPRLELFARRARPGWVAWGDQLDLEEAA